MAPVVASHCRQCNQMSSHTLAATSVAQSGRSWTRDGTLTWYQSSEFAERGFCGTCGCNISWRLSDARTREKVALMAGSFDDQSSLQLERHIFVSHKPDYYEIGDDLPRFKDSDSAEMANLPGVPQPMGPHRSRTCSQMRVRLQAGATSSA